jgi:pimeloyl-ACP methyl ester carboxylesterase
VSGWASDVSVWEDEIYERFPNFSHRFVDYFDLLPNPDDFWDRNPRVGEAGLVVGWSMGTLALLRNLSKKPEGQKWILLCPIADFCADGCWQRSAVRATRQGILENTEQTLASFSNLMGENISKPEREKWVENAMRYSPKQLAMGLDYLMEERAFVGAYCNTPLQTPIRFIFGERDRIVPLAQKKLFKGQSVKVCEGLGHWMLGYFDVVNADLLASS